MSNDIRMRIPWLVPDARPIDDPAYGVQIVASMVVGSGHFNPHSPDEAAILSAPASIKV